MLPTFNSNKRDESTNSRESSTSSAELHSIKDEGHIAANSEANNEPQQDELHQEEPYQEGLHPNDPLNASATQQPEAADNDAQIAELLAPYIANLSLNNPVLYDQLVHTIDQNRIMNNVVPDGNSDFEKIQQMKREMKDDLEADWNTVDPVPFLGEEKEGKSHNDDTSSAKSFNEKNSLGSIFHKIGLGGSESEEDDEKNQQADSASLSTTNNNNRSSIGTKPESMTGKISSVFKRSMGLEEEYDPSSHTNHSVDLHQDIELDKIPPEGRISGDSILDPHVDLSDPFNGMGTDSNQVYRKPGLLHKFLFKYNNQKNNTDEPITYDQSNPAANSNENNLPSFNSTRLKGGKRLLPKKIVPPMRIPFKRNGTKNAQITVHITNLLQKQRFMIRLCKALMLYGAPTHRLEDYLKSTSDVLNIDGQFLYLPGCMIISFDNNSTTSNGAELQLIKCNQGVNLWKLHKVYKIYKLVIHDMISIEEANNEIDGILVEQNLYNKYATVLFYGLASGMVTPFAFGGDWINIAISFCIGCCVGALQFLVAPRSSLYSNVFEITASIVVSFCARALGSIPNSNICFGSVAQGSLALILPGYIILCGALELQNKSLLSGSVRMIYAIIYSLFLSFGITLGAALFAWCYNNASNETTCTKNISDFYKLLWVPCFSVLLALINQAHWTQLFVMTAISCLGYLTTYYSGKHFTNSTEFCASLAAFVIGILGNLYSRVYSGLAVSAILPAIFVQVPSGIASKSSLLTGVQVANQIVNGSKTTQVEETNSGALSFGVQMVQVAIGVTVGLFSSTLVVYPFGKKKTGIFTL